MLEPAELLALVAGMVAIHAVGAAPAQAEQHIQEAQPDAGHQHRGHRHQAHPVTAGIESLRDHRTLVAAEEALDAGQRDRIDIPGVARKIGDPLDPPGLHGMEAVVHRRGEPQGDIDAVDEAWRRRVGPEEFGHRVRKALGLEHLRALHGPAGADDAVAGADQHLGVGVDRPRSRPQFPGEAVMQAGKAGLLRIAEIDIGEQPPHRHRGRPHHRVLDAREPAHESGELDARDAVGEQEVEVFVRGDTGQGLACIHGCVKRLG